MNYDSSQSMNSQEQHLIKDQGEHTVEQPEGSYALNLKDVHMSSTPKLFKCDILIKQQYATSEVQQSCSLAELRSKQPVVAQQIVVAGAHLTVDNVNISMQLCVCSGGTFEMTNCVAADSPDGQTKNNTAVTINGGSRGTIVSCIFEGSTSEDSYDETLINVLDSSLLEVQDTTFSNCPTVANIAQFGCIVFRRCTFTSCDFSTVILDRSSFALFSECRFDGCDQCICAHCGSRVQMDRCVFADCGSCVCLTTGSMLECATCEFSGFSSCSTAIDASGGSKMRLSGCLLNKLFNGVRLLDSYARLHNCTFMDVSHIALSADGLMCRCCISNTLFGAGAQVSLCAEGLAALSVVDCMLSAESRCVFGYGARVALIGTDLSNLDINKYFLNSEVLVCDTASSVPVEPRGVLEVVTVDEYAAREPWEVEDEWVNVLDSPLPDMVKLLESIGGLQLPNSFEFPVRKPSVVTPFNTETTSMILCSACRALKDIQHILFLTNCMHPICNDCVHRMTECLPVHRMECPLCGEDYSSFKELDRQPFKTVHCGDMCKLCSKSHPECLRRACVMVEPCGHCEMCFDDYIIYRLTSSSCSACGHCIHRMHIVPFCPQELSN